MGRPPTCTCGTCEKCKARARKRAYYQKMSPAERKAYVARRSDKAVKKAERKRSAKHDPERQRDHNAAVKRDRKQHPEKDAARRKRPPRPAGQKCTFPGCNNPGTEYHHTSYDPPRGTWRCRAHNPRPGVEK